MSASVLVAYATRYGSTQQVAEAVAATLRERGLEVGLETMRQVRTLEGYRTVVLGAPILAKNVSRLHNHSQKLSFKSSVSGFSRGWRIP